MRLLLIVLSLSFGVLVMGQTPQYGDIFNHISTTISNLPPNGDDDYIPPTTTEIETWDTLLMEVLLYNYSTAATLAASLEYNLIAFWDTTYTPSRLYYLLEKQNNSDHYWGTYLINSSPCSYSLVLQCPHPRADFNTGKEGVFIFRKANAFGYMLSGTHRCNSLSHSSCSGTTTVCGSGSQNYPLSDMAHSTETIFQKTTEVLSNNLAPHFVQLHGFTKQSTDPYVILSNGTQVTPQIDPIVDIRDGLLIADPMLTFKIAHIDTTWTRLRGFFNTQGRMLNNSVNACSTNATTSQGAFIHMEQERSRLRADSNGWNKVYTALKLAFPCQNLPIELIRFDIKNTNGTAILKWHVGAIQNFSHFEIERSINGIDFEFIGKIQTNDAFIYSDDILNINNNNIYYRLKMIDLDNSFLYSSIKKITNSQKTSIQIAPNPASEYLNITFSNRRKTEKEIIIRTILGVPVFSKKTHQNDYLKIGIEDFPKGLYFVEFWENTQRKQTQKILIH